MRKIYEIATKHIEVIVYQFGCHLRVEYQDRRYRESKVYGLSSDHLEHLKAYIKPTYIQRYCEKNKTEIRI